MTKAVVVQHPLKAVNGDYSSAIHGSHHGESEGASSKTAVSTASATNDSDTQLASEEDWTGYRNNADKILNIRIDTSASSIADRDEQIRRVIEVLCPFLLVDDEQDDSEDDDSEDSSASDLQIKPLTGGLSNHLYIVSRNCKPRRCHHPTTASSCVLVRVHPDASSDSSIEIVHREWENRFAAWLAAQSDDAASWGDNGNGTTDKNQHLAPTIYGRFVNGRVEEFYQNVKPLTWGQMKDYAPQIACSMADFHRLNAPSHVLPKPSENDYSRGTIYETTESWLEFATKLVQEALTEEKSSNENYFLLLNELQQQWTWLKQQLFDAKPSSTRSNPTLEEQASAFIRRVVVTHMDCQPLNILVEDATTSTVDKNINSSSCTKPATIRLIDFEYSGWNPIAADIANTFCEYCEMSNLRANYELEYPSPSQQDLFFWHYIQRSDPALAERLKNKGGSNDWEIFSKALQREVGRFSLLSHLSWAIWSVIKSFEEDGVDFDYMVYAAQRMEGYAWAKAKFFDGL